MASLLHIRLNFENNFEGNNSIREFHICGFQKTLFKSHVTLLLRLQVLKNFQFVR